MGVLIWKGFDCEDRFISYNWTCNTESAKCMPTIVKDEIQMDIKERSQFVCAL